MSETKNFGLIRQGTGNAVLKHIPIPKLRDDYILVKTVAIALNPTDWTTLDAVGDDGTIVGCDYAGIVEEVGKDVKRNFNKGDRIAGLGHGGNDANPEHGAFAQYIAVKGDLQFQIPDNLSFEAACTVGVGFHTTGLGLYKYLGLPLPSPGEATQTRDEWIFIYGGSTATGTVALQFAKLSGFKVVTTCSPKHFHLAKDRGADLVYDYHLPNIGQQIREATNGQITKVFDTVSMKSSAKICADAIGPQGGIYCNLLGEHSCPRPDVESVFFLGYSASGELYKFEGETYEAQPDLFVFASGFADIAEKLWAEGKTRAHPQRVGDGGFLGAVHGMDEMRQGRYSGEKLVYRVDGTVFP